MNATMGYLIIHLCSFSLGGQDYAVLPLDDARNIAGYFVRDAFQKEPPPLGILVKPTQEGCKQDAQMPFRMWRNEKAPP